MSDRRRLSLLAGAFASALRGPFCSGGQAGTDELRASGSGTP
jgi:hypothetical protein